MAATKDKRTWSDAQLRQAVVGSQSWRAVARALIDNGENRVRVKGHAVRLGLDCTHLKKLERPAIPVDVFNEPMRPEMLRYAASASALAMAWFSLRGCAVALLVEPQEYDLLVTTANGIQRVQVKTCVHPGIATGAGTWV
jgi:hypothetical protein